MNKKILLHACCGPCSAMCIEYLQKNDFEPAVFYYNPNIHPQKEYFLRLAAMRQVAEHYRVPLTAGSNEKFFKAVRQEDKPLNINALREGKNEIFQPAPLMRQAIEKILAKWKAYAELFPGEMFENLCIYADKAHIENADAELVRALLAVDSYAFVRHLSTYKEQERCKECYKERMVQSVFYAKEQGCGNFTSSLLYSKYQNHEDICTAIENAVNLANRGSKTALHFYYADFRNFWQQGIEKSKELNIYRQKWCGCVLSRLESLEHMAKREYEKLQKKLS